MPQTQTETSQTEIFISAAAQDKLGPGVKSCRIKSFKGLVLSEGRSQFLKFQFFGFQKIFVIKFLSSTKIQWMLYFHNFFPLALIRLSLSLILFYLIRSFSFSLLHLTFTLAQTSRELGHLSPIDSECTCQHQFSTMELTREPERC